MAQVFAPYSPARFKESQEDGNGWNPFRRREDARRYDTLRVPCFFLNEHGVPLVPSVQRQSLAHSSGRKKTRQPPSRSMASLVGPGSAALFVSDLCRRSLHFTKGDVDEGV
jgi:hypothetical protein